MPVRDLSRERSSDLSIEDATPIDAEHTDDQHMMIDSALSADHAITRDDELPCECDDHDPCNGVERCDPVTGACVSGQEVICSDGDVCNGIELCDPLTGECMPGEEIVCDDGEVCNGVEGCDPRTGACLVGEPIVCDDGDACNGVEQCDSQTGACISGEAIICDDGDVCNGVERCDPPTGSCVSGAPVVCSDGDPCNGVEYCLPETGECASPVLPQCPLAPEACDESGGVGTAVEDEVTPLGQGHFRLYDEDTWTAKSQLIDRLMMHPSVSPISLSYILSDHLNREGERISVSGLGCFHDGFMWNNGDNRVEFWWPQGVTGSSDHTNTHRYAGRRVMLVSWYHKPEEDDVDFPKGVRIAIVDHSNLAQVRYRLALLAEPVEENGRVNLVPIANTSSSVHAGGIVWVGNYLYVADTRRGFRVFDLSRIFSVSTGRRSTLGYHASSDQYYAYNYRYVIPQVSRYRLCDSSCCARFSYVSLDRSQTPPRLVVGEYSSDDVHGRLHTWEVDEASGRLITTEGGARSSDAYFLGATHIQGAAMYQGRFYLSSSLPKLRFPFSPGRFLFGLDAGRELSERRYPFLPEDLYYQRQTDELWTCTEYPTSFTGQTRYCLSYQLNDVHSGCD